MYSGRGGKREGAGRPVGSTRPSNLRMRSMRLSDEEYQQIKAYLKQLRSMPKMTINKELSSMIDALKNE